MAKTVWAAHPFSSSKTSQESMRVGIGMVSRGEVGLIVAGVGVSSGALRTNIYTGLITMVGATTIITPCG